MANSFQTKSNAENIYLILVVIFGLVVGYMLYSSAILPVAEESSGVAVKPVDTEYMAKLEALKLDFGIFDNIVFKELKIFGEIPVVPGKTGKADPFGP